MSRSEVLFAPRDCGSPRITTYLLHLCRAGESKAGLDGLMLLMKRIRLIAERNAASPAERLLDELLRLQDAADNAIDASEVQEVPLQCPRACC